MLKLEISYRGLIVVIAVLMALWASIHLWPVILLVIIAFILTVGLLPYVDALEKAGLPRAGAVLLVMFAILGVIVALISLMVPPLVNEATSVRDNLPDSAREVENFLRHLGITVQLQDRARTIDWNALLSGRVAVDYGQRLLSITVSMLTVFVMTAYLLGDTPRLGEFISQFIPDDRKVEAERLFLSLTRVVGGYLRGQAITSLSIGIFTFTFLRIVGVANPLAFAVLAAFADIVPLVGALVATIPPVAAALQQSATTAVIVLVGLIIYQQLEDRILVPRVYGRTLNLPPLIVLVAVLAGAELLGIIGVLLALPFAAAGRVAIDYVITNRRLPLSQPVEQPFAPDAEDAPEPDVSQRMDEDNEPVPDASNPPSIAASRGEANRS